MAARWRASLPICGSGLRWRCTEHLARANSWSTAHTRLVYTWLGLGLGFGLGFGLGLGLRFGFGFGVGRVHTWCSRAWASREGVPPGGACCAVPSAASCCRQKAAVSMAAYSFSPEASRPSASNWRSARVAVDRS